jgi:hypothetical protein
MSWIFIDSMIPAVNFSPGDNNTGDSLRIIGSHDTSDNLSPAMEQLQQYQLAYISKKHKIKNKK